MPLTLHDAVVPNALQMLHAMRRLVDQTESWAAGQGLGEADVLAARLAPDMLPLGYQFKSCWVHTADAIARCGEGQFSPDTTTPPATYAAVRAGLERAIAALEACDADTLEAIAGNEMAFVMQDMRLPFTVQDFLLSFSTPNAWFHAATAYDILRMMGMPLSKRDFMGRLRIRRA